MENEKLKKFFEKIEQYGFTTEDGYYIKKITKQIKMKIYFDYNNNKTENKIRSFTIIKENIKTKNEEKISFSLDNGTNVFGEITNAFEAFYYTFIGEEVKQVSQKEFFIPTDRKLTDEEKQKIIEIINDKKDIQKLYNISKYENSLKEFEEKLNTDTLENDEKNNKTGWQSFFENNKWIFGMTFEHCLIPSRDEQRLKYENVDAFVKTNGKIQYQVIIEIKRNKAKLLQDIPCRKRKKDDNFDFDCYGASEELVNAISQVLQYKRRFLAKYNLEWFENKDNPFSEKSHIVNPKCYVIIGNTEELKEKDDKGNLFFNKSKIDSFELFRRNCKDVEIITYDEIYEKIKYIVNNMKDNNTEKPKTQEETNEINNIDDDIPF